MAAQREIAKKERRAKTDQRIVFYFSALFGLAPIIGQLVIAGALRAGMGVVASPVPFTEQNWLGHLVFLGISVASGSFINAMRNEKNTTRRFKIGFGHLIFFFGLLWLGFGILAVSVGTPPWSAWIVGGSVIVLTTFSAYIVDMELVVLQVS